MRSVTSLSSSILLMTILLVLALIDVRPAFAPQSSSSSSSLEDEKRDSAATTNTATGRYEYIDLEDMSDEELEQICTSRGFELATRKNNIRDDKIIQYTHQYFVDAAWECLQLETDMNETMQANPEIRKDVQREKERMEQDHAAVLLDQEIHSQQYDQQQQQQYHPDSNVTATASSDCGINNSSSNNNTANFIYNIKEITQEVIQQIQKDATKIINFLTPSPEARQMLRKQQVKLHQFYTQHIIPTLKEEVIPVLKSLASVVKDWGITVADMMRRYVQATFIERKGQHHDGGNDGNDDETLPHRSREQSSLNK